MRDSYVVSVLLLWSQWRVRRHDNGSGYPTKSAFVKEVGSGFWTPDLDSQCINVDKAVCALIPERREVLIKHYTEVGTKEFKARRCGVCLRTYDARLAMAHHDMLGLLNDISAGVKLPVHS